MVSFRIMIRKLHNAYPYRGAYEARRSIHNFCLIRASTLAAGRGMWRCAMLWTLKLDDGRRQYNTYINSNDFTQIGKLY